MAKKTETIVTLTDDLDGSKADRTVTFGWEGQAYEIELSRKNANAFEKAIAPYVGAARKVRGGRRAASAARGARTTPRRNLGEIREWAKANGYEVSGRGRVATEVIEAYEAANQ